MMKFRLRVTEWEPQLWVYAVVGGDEQGSFVVVRFTVS